MRDGVALWKGLLAQVVCADNELMKGFGDHLIKRRAMNVTYSSCIAILAYSHK